MGFSGKRTSVVTRKNRSKIHRKTNRNSYKCDECKATFNYKSNCTRHMRNIHGVVHARPSMYRGQIEIAKEVFVSDVRAGASNVRSSDLRRTGDSPYGNGIETAENADNCNEGAGGGNSNKRILRPRLERGVNGLVKTTSTDINKVDNDHLYTKAADADKHNYRGSKNKHIKKSSGNSQDIELILISSDEELEDDSCEEELGSEINILLKMEQDFYKLTSLSQPQKDIAISRWCNTIKKTFKIWHLETWTIFILFDVPYFRYVMDSEIERAHIVVHLNETSPQSLVREVLTLHSQAEVLLQLSYEFNQIDSSGDFGSKVDTFYKKCRKITDIWGLTESVSYSVLSKMFKIF